MAFFADCDDDYNFDDEVWDFADTATSATSEPLLVSRKDNSTAGKPVFGSRGLSCGDPVVSQCFSKPKGVHLGRGRSKPRACNTNGFSIQNAQPSQNHAPDAFRSSLAASSNDAMTQITTWKCQHSSDLCSSPTKFNHKQRSDALTKMASCGYGRGQPFVSAQNNVPQMKQTGEEYLSVDIPQPEEENSEDIQQESTVPRDEKQVNEHWLQRLEEKWSSMEYPKSAAICPMLRKCLSQVANPYLTALYIIEHCKDFHQGKTTTFAFAVAKEFEIWASEDKDKYPVCVDKTVHIAAFHVGCKANMVYLDMLIRAFRMKHPENDYFLQLIKPYIEKKKFKEAAHCVTKLELQDHFTMKDICLPLILQDKINLVESYVCNKRMHQVELLKLLDHLVDSKTNLDKLIRESNVPRVKWDKMTRKILSKLATRLLKLYQVPQEICPNIAKEGLMKGMRYLLYKRYIERGIGTAQWIELIQSTADGNETVQLELVENLVTYNDVEEAARWAKHYNLPLIRLPIQVLPLMDKAESIELVSSEVTKHENSTDDTKSSSSHHVLKLSKEAIHWVDTKEDFYICLNDVNKPGVVGIDAEWRPSIGQMTPQRMSLLQLATHTDVYLLDMLKLQQVLSEGDWRQWAHTFFASEQVTKVGYSLEGDLQMICRMLPSIREAMNALKNVVDLQTIYINICKVCPTAFDTAATAHKEQPGCQSAVLADSMLVIKSEERGLSDLVRLCLGKPLNKEQQMSDWEKRPLRPQQMMYAALDAYCLLEVYDALVAKIKELGLNVNTKSTINSKTKPRKTKNERKQHHVAEKIDKTGNRMQMPPNPPSCSGPPISPCQLKVVCDNMLQGLGRYLRCCGVDVYILDNEDPHDKCAIISRNEDRIILTSGSPFIMLRNQVPVGYCYNVGPGKAKDQVKEVLNHFNVEVSSGDIFTRCQICNGDHYLLIDPAEMRQAWIRKMASLTQGQKVTSLQAAPEPSLNMGSSNKESSESKPRGQAESANSDRNVAFDHIDLNTLTVGPNHVPLLVESLPEAMLDKVEEFYVCATCGKVFWEGGHFRRVRDHFSHIIKTDTPGTYLENLFQRKKKLK